MTLELNYEDFKNDLYKVEDLLGGVHYIFKFSNGYGASVVKHPFSYGHENDLWELGVLIFKNGKHGLCYTTEITDDVIGYLTDDGVMELLEKIKAIEA